MRLLNLLIIIGVFVFFVFMIGDIETAISGISVSEPLKPLFDAIPYLLIGAVFIAIAYVGLIQNE